MEEFCKTVRDIVQRAYWRIDKIYTGEKCMKIIDRLREDGIHIPLRFSAKDRCGI